MISNGIAKSCAVGLFGTIILCALSACLAFNSSNGDAYSGSSRIAHHFQPDTWAQIQAAQRYSLESKAEVCAYMPLDPPDTGNTRATFSLGQLSQGNQNGCRPYWDQTTLKSASFHTHGHYLANSLSELPSTTDYLADKRQGIVGFVATPGGRLWRVDPAADRIELLCDLNCLPADPRWRAELGDPYPPSLTFADLQRYEQMWRQASRI